MHVRSIHLFVEGSLDRVSPVYQVIFFVCSNSDSLSYITMGIRVKEGYISLDQLADLYCICLQDPARDLLSSKEKVVADRSSKRSILDLGVLYMYLPRSWCVAIADSR